MSMNKGFTLLESLIVLVVLSTITLGTIVIRRNDYHEYQIVHQLLKTQVQAILKNKQFCYENDEIHHSFPVCYNAKGNINRSQTLYFNQFSGNRRIIVYLGTGKLYLQ